MKTIRRTTQFKKDVKRAKRRGKDLGTLKEVIEKLVTGEPLEARYRDHALSGPWRGTRDCHLEPDWLLLYQTSSEEIVLVRTGTHSDLFDE
ncbi:MAG: type II toxin-antitoxin system YafQ family toxin [Bacteroidota bacterium]